MPNSGYVNFTNLEEYYLDNGIATGTIVTNLPSDPNYIPVSYNTTLCPLPSVSPSLTPTPSITPSTTPQGIAGRYNVSIYANILGLSVSNEVAHVYYSLDNVSWTFFGTVNNASCVNLGSISVNGGSNLYLAMMTGSDGFNPNNGNGTSNDVDTVFYANASSNCVHNRGFNVEYCGTSLPYVSAFIVQNRSISLGAVINPNTQKLKECGTGYFNRIVPTPSSSPGVYFTSTVNIAAALADVCANNYNTTTINVVGNNTLYCTSERFYSNYFPTLPIGTYYIEKDGYTLEIVTDGSDFATVTDPNCVLCASVPVTPTPTLTPTPTPSVGSIPTVTSFGTSLFSCLTTNDYVGYYVNTDIPVNEDTTFYLSIDMVNGNNEYQYTNSIPVVINSGYNTNVVGSNPCISGGFLSNGLSPNSVCIASIYSGSSALVNPFGYCSGPIPTPTPTPTATISTPVSVTPTPTISVTPSITVTPTITPTPSTSTPLSFFVENNGGGAFNISAISAVQDLTNFYEIDSGTFPVSNGGTINGKLKYNVTGPVKVTVASYSSTSGLTLYKNGILQQCLTVTGNGDYIFTAVSFNKTTDSMTIKVESAC
jgi:hypothetical protein